MERQYRRTRLACYATNVSMSVVGNLSPLLFLTFRSLYGISYSLLGLLVLINFCTQLTVDLIFSFFSHRFPIPRTVKITPVLAIAGLSIYAVWPFFFPQSVYAGLVLGTVVFSASGGLSEVLISPVVAAIPSENPERDMSRLHAVYAWGVVAVILFGTLFLLLFGSEYWQILTLLLTVVPLTAAILFSTAEIPPMQTPERASGALRMLRNKTLWLCVLAIFLGGAAECTMAQWSSGYLERGLEIPKVWGDVFGVALFAMMLGLGRSLYAKRGRHVERVLLLGAIGATLCYLITALSPIPLLGLLACAATGFCVSMLWPGCLVVASDRVPDGGVFVYAIMASGGDLGASVAPQLIGLVTDAASQNPTAIRIATELGLQPDQLGMKLGMLIGMLFPLAAITVYGVILKTRQKATSERNQ